MIPEPLDDVTIRIATLADVARIRAFHHALSAESSYTRFFSASRDAADRAPFDPRTDFALIAERRGEIVAVAECCRSACDPSGAEIAVAVLDRMQHHGLATRLLDELRRIGRERGVRELTAHVLATNAPMMHVLRHASPAARVRLREGVYDVVLTLDELSRGPSPAA